MNFDNSEIQSWKFCGDFINDFLPLCTIVPLFKECLFKKTYLKFKSSFKKKITILEKIVKERNREQIFHEKNITDFLLFERKKILEKNPKLFKELSDQNIARLFFDLIIGSTNSTATTLFWLILLMKSNLQFEKRLKKEVINVIGNRSPKLEDMNDCNFVMAFISETMRFRNVAPFSGPHKCLKDYKHGELLLIEN